MTKIRRSRREFSGLAITHCTLINDDLTAATWGATSASRLTKAAAGDPSKLDPAGAVPNLQR